MYSEEAMYSTELLLTSILTAFSPLLPVWALTSKSSGTVEDISVLGLNCNSQSWVKMLDIHSHYAPFFLHMHITLKLVVLVRIISQSLYINTCTVCASRIFSCLNDTNYINSYITLSGGTDVCVCVRLTYVHWV